MKSSKIFGLALVAVTVVSGLLVSCEKSFDEKLPTDSALNNSATVQIYSAILNSTRNYVYIDGKQVTGSTLGFTSLFPATGNGIAVTGGLKPFLIRDTLSTTTQVPLTFAENMQVGGHQTVFLYDTITAPKQKTVVDNIVIPSDTTARIRFANFAYDPGTAPAVDIYSARRQGLLFSNVAYTQVTDFIPIASGVPDTLYVRTAGSTTNLQNFTPTPTPTWSDIRIIITPTIKRSYTLVWRGSYKTTTTTLAVVRGFSFFASY